MVSGTPSTVELPHTTGLSRAEVEERVQRGEVNAVCEITSRRLIDIIIANVFTQLNIMIAALLALILVFGSWEDGLFGFALLGNILIGTVQEVRAKRTLDRLQILTAPVATVVRDGAFEEIPAGEVVLDDVIRLNLGDQVVADGIVLSSVGLEIDESVLTGEAAPVPKKPGDEALSGSFVTAGSGTFRTTKVGANAYVQRLSSEARQFKLASSELRNGIKLIIRWVSWLMIPVGVVLFVGQIGSAAPFGEVISTTVAGIVGMVPQGLAILMSLAFVASAVVLAQRNVLVQDLPAIEGLARVDVVCVDKTGTLTEGDLELRDIEPLADSDCVKQVLGAFAAALPDVNTTMRAVRKAFPPVDGWIPGHMVPFSSARKWSAAEFRDRGTWVLGAPDIIMNSNSHTDLRERVRTLSESGLRVLLMARSDQRLDGEQLPVGLEPMALVVLEEKVRPDAAATLKYFYDQGVTVKVISGDSAATVGAVAQRAGVRNGTGPMDARNLPVDPAALSQVMEDKTIFGRVTPEQKRRMVEALQSKGHVVAMTGDGVNDILALKKADVAVAMGSGAPATRAVAQLILIDGKFATMPGVVAEGRKVVANIETVANLFLVKVSYIVLLSLLITAIDWPFPFLPRHLTIIDSLTISTPATILALAPNARRYIPGFVGRVLRFAVPVGIIAGLAALSADVMSSRILGVAVDESRTMAAIVLIIIGLRVVLIVARPLNLWKVGMVAGMGGAFVIALAVPFIRTFFALDIPSLAALLQTLSIAAVGLVALEIFWRVGRWRGWIG